MRALNSSRYNKNVEMVETGPSFRWAEKKLNRREREIQRGETREWMNLDLTYRRRHVATVVKILRNESFFKYLYYDVISSIKGRHEPNRGN